MTNIAVYRDTEDSVGVVVAKINDLCGVVVQHPRPDLRGNYIVTDILSIQVIPFATGWGAVAIVSVHPEESSVPYLEVGYIEEDGTRVGISGSAIQ